MLHLRGHIQVVVFDSHQSVVGTPKTKCVAWRATAGQRWREEKNNERDSLLKFIYHIEYQIVFIAEGNTPDRVRITEPKWRSHITLERADEPRWNKKPIHKIYKSSENIENRWKWLHHPPQFLRSFPSFASFVFPSVGSVFFLHFVGAVLTLSSVCARVSEWVRAATADCIQIPTPYRSRI